METIYQLAHNGSIDPIETHFDDEGVKSIENGKAVYYSIKPTNWQRDEKSRVFPTEFWIVDHELEDVISTLSSHEINFQGFLIPAVTLTFFKRNRKEFIKQEFEKPLFILDRIRKGYELDGFSLRLKNGLERKSISVNLQDLNLALQEYLLYYLGNQQALLENAITNQNSKQVFSFNKNNRNKACFDAFQSLSDLDIANNERFINVGKLLVATGHIDVTSSLKMGSRHNYGICHFGGHA